MIDAIPASDLLAAAVDLARQRMLPIAATKQRVRILWAAAKQARELGAREEIHDAFMALAIDVNLIDRRGYWTGADVRDTMRRFGAEDVSHTITWALRVWNAFEAGPLT